MMQSSLKLSESDIERACTDWLSWDGWRSLKTDPVSRREWGKGFGELGMADHLYIRYEALDYILSGEKPPTVKYHATTQVLWIEWKRKGPKAAQHQKDWHLLERKRGALTLIAGEDFLASVQGFQDWYRASGLQRKAIS